MHWNLVLEKTLEKTPLDCKEIKPINPKGNQPWTFIGRTVAEAKAPMFWPPDAKSWLIGKDPDAGKDWRQRRGWQRTRWLDSITNLVNMNLSKVWETVEDRGAWCATAYGVAKSGTWFYDWTTMCQCNFIDCNKCTTLVRDVDDGNTHGPRIHGKSLDFLLNFAVKLKVL